MQQHNDDNDHRRQGCQPSSATSTSSPHETNQAAAVMGSHPSNNHHLRHILKPKQLLQGADICSRFEQVIGKGMPKRMTTGKFVYLGPTDHLPDSPL